MLSDAEGVLSDAVSQSPPHGLEQHKATARCVL